MTGVAVGIGAAWLFSITLLPALISILPYKVKQTTGDDRGEKVMASVAEFVIAKPRRVLLGLGGATLLLTAFIPTIDFNDHLPKTNTGAIKS